MSISQGMHELNGSDARENAMKYFTEHGYEYQCYGDNNFWVHCTDPDDSGGDDLGVDCAFTFEEEVLLCHLHLVEPIKVGVQNWSAVLHELNRINNLGYKGDVRITQGVIAICKTVVCYPKDEGQQCERIMRELLDIYLREGDNLRRVVKNDAIDPNDSSGEVVAERFFEYCKKNDYACWLDKLDDGRTMITCAFYTPNSMEVATTTLIPPQSYSIIIVSTGIRDIPEHMLEPAKSLACAVMNKYPHIKAYLFGNELQICVEVHSIPSIALDALIDAHNVMLNFLKRDFDQIHDKLLSHH